MSFHENIVKKVTYQAICTKCGKSIVGSKISGELLLYFSGTMYYITKECPACDGHILYNNITLEIS